MANSREVVEGEPLGWQLPNRRGSANGAQPNSVWKTDVSAVSTRRWLWGQYLDKECASGFIPENKHGIP